MVNNEQRGQMTETAALPKTIDVDDILVYLLQSSISSKAEIAVLRASLARHGIETSGQDYEDAYQRELQLELRHMSEDPSPLGGLAQRLLELTSEKE